MDDGKNFRTFFFHGFSNVFGIDRLSPLRIDSREFAADPVDDIAHPGAEHTVDADHDFIAGFNKIHKTGLHSRAPCPRNGNGQLVFRLEQEPQQLLCFVHQEQKGGIKVADAWRGHGLKHTRGDITGTGTHEDPLARVKIFKIICVKTHTCLLI